MVIASQLRAGTLIRFQGANYKVVAADYHPGQGQMGGSTHARLQNVDTHTSWEHNFRADCRLEEVPLERRGLEFLYADAVHCCFMDPQTFDQHELKRDMVGPQADFLEAGTIVVVEFAEGNPIAVVMPPSLEVRIADTAPALHQQQDTNFKTARLENGVAVLVPQFVKTGDMIRIDLATLRYMDRAKGKR